MLKFIAGIAFLTVLFVGVLNIAAIWHGALFIPAIAAWTWVSWDVVQWCRS